MGDFYIDSTVPGPGSGALGDPWDDLASNVNSQGNGPHTFHLRGGIVAQVYTELEVNVTVDDIIIQPYQAELVEFRGTNFYAFDLHGDDITIEGKDQLDINKNHDTGTCIYVREGADDCFINDCVIRGARGAGAGGIRVRGHRLTVDGCDIYDHFQANNLDCAGISHQKGEDLTVRNCSIGDCFGDGLIVDDAHTPGPFFVYDTEFYTTLANCSENGIDAKVNGPAAAVQSVISGCTFHGFRACTGDCGGTGDPQGEALGLRNSCGNVLIEDCLFYDCTTGILLDDGTSDYIIRECVIRDLVTAAVDPNATFLTALMIRAHDVTIYNCTFDDCPEESIRFTVPLSNVTIENCIFNDCGTIVGDGLAGWSADYNCWYGCTDRLIGAHDVTTDPLFVNEAGNDFRLQVASDCIDAGINKGLPYYGAAPDLGRYEYQPPGPGGSTVYVVVVVQVNTTVVLQSP